MINRRHFLLGTVLALSVVALAPYAGEATRPQAPCEIVAQWVNENREAIPQTLVGLSKLPMAYRRAAVATLPMSVRRSLWREHISSFISDSTRLTTDQRSIIRTTLAHLDEYVDTTGAGKAARIRDGLTTARVNAVFGDSLAAAIFATLGPADPVVKGKALPHCDCNRAEDFCSKKPCSTVSQAGEWCAVVRGCGWLWCDLCDGTCPYSEMSLKNQE
jgi:hypothetical protein